MSASHQDQSDATGYPTKVKKLLALIKELKPGTDELSWIKKIDNEIGLPEEDVILDGGAGLGESWGTIGIGAGDEWALSTLSYMGNDPNKREIFEAKVIRTSISKALANKPHDVKTIFPYYLKGHLMWKEAKPWEVPNIDPEPSGAGQPTTKSADKVPANDQPSTPTPKDVPR
jgi:hypothetical protein